MSQPVRLGNVASNPVEKGVIEPRPFVALEHIESFSGRTVDDFEPEERLDDQAVTFIPGDVLFGKLRPYLAKVFQPDWQGSASGELLVLRPLSAMAPRFLYYLTLSKPFLEWANATSFGVKMPRTSWELLREYLVELPPLDEQRAIADFLDRETARIDTLIEKRQSLIYRLGERRQAMIGRLVSGISGDRQAGYPRVPLKRLARVTYGLGQPPPSSDEGVPILRATNIERGRINPAGLIYAQVADIPLDRAPLLKAGEILVVRTGAYTGDSALVTEEWEGAVPGYDLRLTPNPGTEPRYLAYQLLSDDVLRQVDLERSRAAQPHLNAEELGGLVVHLPSRSDQVFISDRLDHETRRLDLLMDKERQFIDLALERRVAIITAAVTGQLDVTKAA